MTNHRFYKSLKPLIPSELMRCLKLDMYYGISNRTWRLLYIDDMCMFVAVIGYRDTCLTVTDIVKYIREGTCP